MHITLSKLFEDIKVNGTQQNVCFNPERAVFHTEVCSETLYVYLCVGSVKKTIHRSVHSSARSARRQGDNILIKIQEYINENDRY